MNTECNDNYKQGKNFDGKQILKGVFVFCLLFISLFVFAQVLSTSLTFEIGGDWKVYRDACLLFLNGNNPYFKGFYSPVWSLFLLLPVSQLSLSDGSKVMFVVNLLCFGFTFYKLKIHPLLCIPLFWVTLNNSVFGNIEGIVSLGFFMNPIIGLFFVMAKPQIGIGMAIYWAISIYREHGKNRVILLFSPLFIAYVSSFIFYGNYWMLNNPIAEIWNSSIFPYGIPYGMLLIFYSVWKKDVGGAISAGVLFSPYVNSFMSWGFLWIGLASILSNRFRELRESTR